MNKNKFCKKIRSRLELDLLWFAPPPFSFSLLLLVSGNSRSLQNVDVEGFTRLVMVCRCMIARHVQSIAAWATHRGAEWRHLLATVMHFNDYPYRTPINSLLLGCIGGAALAADDLGRALSDDLPINEEDRLVFFTEGRETILHVDASTIRTRPAVLRFEAVPASRLNLHDSGFDTQALMIRLAGVPFVTAILARNLLRRRVAMHDLPVFQVNGLTVCQVYGVLTIEIMYAMAIRTRRRATLAQHPCVRTQKWFRAIPCSRIPFRSTLNAF